MVLSIHGEFMLQDFIGNLFGKKKNIEIDISLKDQENRAEYRLELLNNEVYFFPIYGVYDCLINQITLQAKEDISGTVSFHIPNKGRLEHTGISIELIGALVDFTNGASVTELLHEEKQIEKPGTIMGKKVQ